MSSTARVHTTKPSPSPLPHYPTRPPGRIDSAATFHGNKSRTEYSRIVTEAAPPGATDTVATTTIATVLPLSFVAHNVTTIPEGGTTEPAATRLVPVVGRSPYSEINEPTQIVVRFVITKCARCPRVPGPARPVATCVDNVDTSQHFDQTTGRSTTRDDAGPAMCAGTATGERTAEGRNVETGTPPTTLAVANTLADSRARVAGTVRATYADVINGPISNSHIAFIRFTVLRLSSISNHGPDYVWDDRPEVLQWNTPNKAQARGPGTTSFGSTTSASSTAKTIPTGVPTRPLYRTYSTFYGRPPSTIRRSTIRRTIFTNRVQISSSTVVNHNHLNGLHRRAIPCSNATTRRISAPQVSNLMNTTLLAHRTRGPIIRNMNIIRKSTRTIRTSIVMFLRPRDRHTRHNRHTKRTSSHTNTSHQRRTRHLISILISIHSHFNSFNFTKEVITRITLNRTRKSGIRQRYNLCLHKKHISTITTRRGFYKTTTRIRRRVQKFRLTTTRSTNHPRRTRVNLLHSQSSFKTRTRCLLSTVLRYISISNVTNHQYNCRSSHIRQILNGSPNRFHNNHMHPIGHILDRPIHLIRILPRTGRTRSPQRSLIRTLVIRAHGLRPSQIHTTISTHGNGKFRLCLLCFPLSHQPNSHSRQKHSPNVVISLNTVVTFDNHFRSFNHSIFHLSTRSSDRPRQRASKLGSSIATSDAQSPVKLAPSPVAEIYTDDTYERFAHSNVPPTLALTVQLSSSPDHATDS